MIFADVTNTRITDRVCQGGRQHCLLVWERVPWPVTPACHCLSASRWLSTETMIFPTKLVASRGSGRLMTGGGGWRCNRVILGAHMARTTSKPLH